MICTHVALFFPLACCHEPSLSPLPTRLSLFTSLSSQIKLRMDNERYLRSHPEIQHLIHEFTKSTLQMRPDDIQKFAAEFFADADRLRTLAATAGPGIAGQQAAR